MFDSFKMSLLFGVVLLTIATQVMNNLYTCFITFTANTGVFPGSGFRAWFTDGLYLYIHLTSDMTQTACENLKRP